MPRGGRSKKLYKRALGAGTVAKILTPIVGETLSAPTSGQQDKNNTIARSSQETLVDTSSSQLAQLGTSSSFHEIDFNTRLALGSTITESSANSSYSAPQSELSTCSTLRVKLPSSTIPHCSISEKDIKMPPIMIIAQPHGLKDFLTATGIDTIDGRDTWLSYLGMKLKDVVPCLPQTYEADGLAGKAVYVLGIPNRVGIPEVRRLFARHGKVEKCPHIIDMESEDTFRFVVMCSAAEADKAVHKLHGSLFKGKNIQVCKALNSNDDLRFPGVYTVEQIFAGELNPTPEQLKKIKEKLLKEAKERQATETKVKEKGPAVPAVPQITTTQAALTIHGHPASAQIAVVQQPLQQHLEPPFHQFAPQPAQQSIAPLVQQFAQQTLQPAAPLFVPQSQPESSATHPLLPSHSPILQSEAEELSTVVREVATAEFRSQAVSWAAIASNSADKSKTIDLNPERKTISAAPRLHPVGRIPSISVTQPTEPMVEQMRVVFILNLPANITLQDISDAIIEGPLVSIRFGIDANDGSRYAGIIFQFARDAETFYQVLCKERVEAKPIRFRFVTDVVRGEAFLADDVITAMSAPHYATRRLTIVKSRFFFIFGERHLKNLCDKAVGADNVQLIWLYNGGNATVVFAEVAAAMKIKKILDKMSDDATNKGPTGAVWEGLQTTYSKDPCVQLLRLETAMHD